MWTPASILPTIMIVLFCSAVPWNCEPWGSLPSSSYPLSLYCWILECCVCIMSLQPSLNHRCSTAEDLRLHSSHHPEETGSKADCTDNASLCLDFHLPTASSQLALWRLSPAIIKSPHLTAFPPIPLPSMYFGYCCCLVRHYIASLTPSPHPKFSLKIYFIFFIMYICVCLGGNMHINVCI